MAAHNVLIPARDQGWLQGYANLLKKENRSWWKTRFWIVQTIIWLLIVNGLLAMILFVAPRAEANQAAGQAAAQAGQQDPAEPPLDMMALTLLFTMGALAPAVGVVIKGQEAVIHEKQTGTAAWVLSKPASRPAFLLSKLTANALGILVTMVVIQGAVAYLQIAIATGTRFPILPFMGGMGLVYLTLLFYLALTLMLGTLFNARGAVIGIPMRRLLANRDCDRGLLPDRALYGRDGAGVPDAALLPGPDPDAGDPVQRPRGGDRHPDVAHLRVPALFGDRSLAGPLHALGPDHLDGRYPGIRWRSPWSTARRSPI